MRDDRCTAPECRASGGIRCDYVDGRARCCPTVWCSRHWVITNGKPYCRRHAGVVEAIADEYFAGGWPEVDNRAASLAGWVSRELDPSVRSILKAAAPSDGATLIVDPVRLVGPPGHRRRWQRAWKLVNQVGVLHKVAIEVD